MCGFSSATAQPDGLTPSTWIPASFGSKKHSVSWLTKRTDAVFLPASGKKTRSSQKSSSAYKMRQSVHVPVLRGPCFVSPHQPPVRFLLEHKIQRLYYQRWKQLCVRDAASFCPFAACFLNPTVAVKTLVDNEDINFKRLLHSTEEYLILSASTAQIYSSESRIHSCHSNVSNIMTIQSTNDDLWQPGLICSRVNERCSYIAVQRLGFNRQ